MITSGIQMKLALYLLFTLSLAGGAFLVFRVIVRSDYLQNGRASAVSALLELLICIAYMAFPFTYLPYDWYLLPTAGVPAARKVIAFSLLGVGLALTLFSMFLILGIKRAMGWKVDQLITSGTYQYSRNPQLVSFALVIFGVVVFWPSWYHLGWIALYGVVFHLMVITEEEHLDNIYQETYFNYCKRVPRYIGIPKHIKADSQS